MTLLGICFDSASPGAPHGHDTGLTILSFVAAGLASFCALDMAERLRGAEGRARNFWLVMSGLTLGAGVWSMHFIGMTAFTAPFAQNYRPLPTALSGVIAVVAVIAGLAALGRKPSLARIGISGVAVGLGVACMHYVGMAALDIPAKVAYRPGIFAVSILIAITAAAAALWLTVAVKQFWQRAGAALAMAVAICGMHYTAMAGTVLIVDPTAPHDDLTVSRGMLAAVVAASVVGMVLVGLVLAYLDRRMVSQANAESARLREINAELEAARREAEQATIAKSQFLATMSHEIRTPMNGVLGMLEVVMRTRLDAAQRDSLVTARDSAASLLLLLNDILDYSKLEAGQLRLETLAFSVRREADDVLSLLEARAAEKELSFSAEIAPDVPDWVMGDPTRFRQLLTNLAGNALKFTAQGEVRIRIRYFASKAGDELRVEVIDTGIGVSPDEVGRLFTRFSQADASTTRKFGGTGLGLAICKQIVEQMRGEIGVDSEQGCGSTFWFRIPTSEGAEPDWTERSALPVKAIDLPAKRILVAEDNPVNRKVISALIAPHGHQLTLVDNGLKAVQALQAEAFDVVLMDVSMPVMDGPTATQEIRKLAGPMRDVPIIALTANAMAGDREIYLDAGMTDYVSKPIDVNALLAAIARQTGGVSPVEVVGAATPVAPVRAEDALAAANVLNDLELLLDGGVLREKAA